METRSLERATEPLERQISQLTADVCIFTEVEMAHFFIYVLFSSLLQYHTANAKKSALESRLEELSKSHESAVQSAHNSILNHEHT